MPENVALLQQQFKEGCIKEACSGFIHVLQ
jgi:hypothetical protein